MRALVVLSAGWAVVVLATPASAADIGSPVPMPTGDPKADVAAIVGYLENAAAATERREVRRDAEMADLRARLSALETRLASAERFAARAGYVPPVVNVAPAPVATPAPAVAVGVPPTMQATSAPPAAVVSTPLPATSVTGSTFTSAPVTVQRGGTEYRTGPLGFIRWRVGAGGGCATGR